ncbi:TetR family transcriptional regulator [Streptomyces sp. NBC_00151]|uniref:TetR family transcriptional regulator n=1 Tax=Streptomyces sp. NBC_00151 TaxID=2975669 RepID=UPI003FA3BB28
MAEQERAVRTRERLIGSAAETFCREGFAAASLCVISAQAGVSSGALHFHFAGKAALADAVESAALDRLRIIAGVASREGGGPAPVPGRRDPRARPRAARGRGAAGGFRAGPRHGPRDARRSA